MLDYLSDRSAAIILAPQPDRVFVGSAVCVKVGNHYFLATAAHNFDEISDLDQIRLLPRGQRGRGDAAVVELQRSSVHDVAALEIDSSYAIHSGLRFLGLHDLSCGHRHDPTVPFLLQGYPCREVSVHSADDIEPSSLALMTSSTDTGGSTDVLALEYPPQSAGDVGLALVAPHGISGGGVWRYPSFESAKLWSPTAARLVAISSRWIESKGQELAEPIEFWLQMLLE